MVPALNILGHLLQHSLNSLKKSNRPCITNDTPVDGVVVTHAYHRPVAVSVLLPTFTSNANIQLLIMALHASSHPFLKKKEEVAYKNWQAPLIQSYQVLRVGIAPDTTGKLPVNNMGQSLEAHVRPSNASR